MDDLHEERLKTDIHTIKNTLTSLGLKVELVYAALSGNEISKDGGLVAEIAEQKATIKSLTQRVESVEKRENKRQVYINIIWGALGFIIAVVINYLFKR